MSGRELRALSCCFVVQKHILAVVLLLADIVFVIVPIALKVRERLVVKSCVRAACVLRAIPCSDTQEDVVGVCFCCVFFLLLNPGDGRLKTKSFSCSFCSCTSQPRS